LFDYISYVVVEDDDDNPLAVHDGTSFHMLLQIHTKFHFFDYISYVIVENDDDDPLAVHDGTSFHIQVQVGDVVVLKEITKPDNNSFAIVKAIITHKANNGQVYTFFIFILFEDLEKTHLTLECA
jgi:hypothetical protein